MELKNINIDNSAEGYIPSQELIYAAEVAYALKRPLLLSGEPGTGKTGFAKWAADTLSKKYNFSKEPLMFSTKSTSSAQDLFYYYDAVSHFRDANFRHQLSNPSDISTNEQKTTKDYIELKALGLAFQRAKGSKSILTDFPISIEQKGSVVLIDEIDKAPRDFPNDLLNEIEQYRFSIREIDKEIILSEDEKKIF